MPDQTRMREGSEGFNGGRQGVEERRKSERAPLGPGRAKVDVMDRRTGKAWRECVDDTDRGTREEVG
jgi:hypothetical protein